eukprot:ANDGO_04699.mRNA.1 hypothetical protein
MHAHRAKLVATRTLRLATCAFSAHLARSRLLTIRSVCNVRVDSTAMRARPLFACPVRQEKSRLPRATAAERAVHGRYPAMFRISCARPVLLGLSRLRIAIAALLVASDSIPIRPRQICVPFAPMAASQQLEAGLARAVVVVAFPMLSPRTCVFHALLEQRVAWMARNVSRVWKGTILIRRPTSIANYALRR